MHFPGYCKYIFIVCLFPLSNHIDRSRCRLFQARNWCFTWKSYPLTKLKSLKKIIIGNYFTKVPGQFEKLSPSSSLDVFFTLIAVTITFCINRNARQIINIVTCHVAWFHVSSEVPVIKKNVSMRTWFDLFILCMGKFSLGPCSQLNSVRGNTE